MPTPDRRTTSNSRYFLRFAGTATLLVAGTLVLVLYVLPQRYVLSSGFRESAVSLPDPSTPFEPVDAVRVAALPAPLPPDEAPIGPAEAFWARVIPLLDAERYEEAIPLFASYLATYPGDRSVRREYALTLVAAGYLDRAIPLFESLLAASRDPQLRLVLARALRDEGRVDEAAIHYARLVAASPQDEALALEYARALAWTERYADAEDVLLSALDRHPGSIPLRVALAEIYYYTDRLEEADAILSAMTEDELAAAGALSLRDGIRFALTPPPEPEEAEPAPPTDLELAIRAREDGDLQGADALYRAWLAEHPDDALAWEAYANFLQYATEDLDGALAALKEVERIREGGGPALQYRMAQLEIWTDRQDDARRRLLALLAALDAQGPGVETAPVAADSLAAFLGLEPAPPVSRADVLALLGDLDRWSGNRLAAVRSYEAALAEDPEHPGATEGLAAIRAEVDRMYVEVERPWLAAVARSLADSDDFLRVDLGGDWRGIHDDWVWGTRAGGRWLEGRDLVGTRGDRAGAFADLEGGRWWRWGTIRTALHLGVQDVRDGSVDLSLGASGRFVGASGRRTDVRVESEPAWGVTNTLQAVLAEVRQERVSVAHTQPLGERWAGALSVEAASLNHRGLPGSDRNLRLQGGLSVGRVFSPRLTVGVAGRVLHYQDAAPDAGGFPLYWDPDLNLSAGPFVQLDQPLSLRWQMVARLTPAVGWIDERGIDGGEVVPDVSASLGFDREGARYRTSIEFFYGQGRFTGYRSYGVNVSFGGIGWLGRAGGGS